ncbi:MAG: tetratricopeptide repeat protein [Isosphaerales bacterium]
MSTTTTSFMIEATGRNFQQDVIERSRTVPVVVDFWATWCAPCRMLSPVLEKLAREYDGRFVLAKVESDREPELSAQFGVRSIPAVFGVRDGRAIDAFVGVQPESMIRAWLDRLLPTPAETLAADARSLEMTDPQAAEAKYKAALSLDGDLPAAQTGLARIALEQGRLDDASALIAALERRGYLEPEAEKVKAELTLRTQAQQAGGITLEAARGALATSPDDRNLKFQLAEALAAAGQYADALALCLELVERDGKGIGEKARQTMIAIFQLLPPGSELVTEYQRLLSLALAV